LGTTGLYESKNGGTIELVLRTVGYMVLQKFVFILRAVGIAHVSPTYVHVCDFSMPLWWTLR